MKFTGWLFSGLKVSIAIVLFAIMILTGIDVIGRYVFNRPVGGADEIIAAGMAVLIFGSLPLVAMRSEQITIDTLSGMLHGAAKEFQFRLVQFISSVVLGYLSYRLFLLAEKMTRSGEHSSLLHIPYGALSYLLAGMAAISAIVTVVLLLRPEIAPVKPTLVD